SIRFDAYGVPRAPHSFPTRRSSDLEVDIDTSALVPARTLGDFSRSLTGGNVDIALSTSDSRGAGEGMIGFEHDGKRTTTRLIDSDFVSYESRFPTEFAAQADVPVAPLAEAVKR